MLFFSLLTKMASFTPLSNHLSSLSNMCTFLPSKECPLSLRYRWTPESWPGKLALLCCAMRLWSCCLVSSRVHALLAALDCIYNTPQFLLGCLVLRMNQFLSELLRHSYHSWNNNIFVPLFPFLSVWCCCVFLFWLAWQRPSLGIHRYAVLSWCVCVSFLFHQSLWEYSHQWCKVLISDSSCSSRFFMLLSTELIRSVSESFFFSFRFCPRFCPHIWTSGLVLFSCTRSGDCFPLLRWQQWVPRRVTDLYMTSQLIKLQTPHQSVLIDTFLDASCNIFKNKKKEVQLPWFKTLSNIMTWMNESLHQHTSSWNEFPPQAVWTQH